MPRQPLLFRQQFSICSSRVRPNCLTVRVWQGLSFSLSCCRIQFPTQIDWRLTLGNEIVLSVIARGPREAPAKAAIFFFYLSLLECNKMSRHHQRLHIRIPVPLIPFCFSAVCRLFYFRISPL